MVILRRLIFVLLLLLALILGLLFALQNNAAVPLDLLVVQLGEQPVANWILLAFGLGGLTGMAISSLAVVRLRASRARLQRRLDQREKDQAEKDLIAAREQSRDASEPRELTVAS